MSNFPWLTTIGLIPLVGALVVALLPASLASRARQLALGFSVVTLLFTIAAALQFLPKAAETAEMYVAFSKRSRCYPVLAKGFSDQIAAAVRSKEVDRLLAAAEKESRKP